MVLLVFFFRLKKSEFAQISSELTKESFAFSCQKIKAPVDKIIQNGYAVKKIDFGALGAFQELFCSIFSKFPLIALLCVWSLGHSSRGVYLCSAADVQLKAIEEKWPDVPECYFLIFKA